MILDIQFIFLRLSFLFFEEEGDLMRITFENMKLLEAQVYCMWLLYVHFVFSLLALFPISTYTETDIIG